MRCFTLLQLLCFLSISSISLQAQVLPEQNDNIFSLKVANIELKVDSAHGAKISSLTIDGNEFLVKTNTPIYGLDMFWGSTAWIAPESEGAWPPWAKIDNNPCTVEIKDSIMTFYSPIDKDKNRNEFQMIKSYWASSADTSINIRYSIINKGSKTLRKAVWEVTRVAPEGLTFFAKGENKPWGWDNFDMSQEVVGAGDLYWMQYRPDLDDEKKFVCNAGEGWLAHVNGSGQMLIKKFEDVPASAYTTNDDEVEYYVGVDHVFLEIENQSKYAELAPGDTLTYDVSWYLRNVPQDVEITIGSAGLVDFARHLTDSKAQGGSINTGIRRNHNNDRGSIFPNPSGDRIVVDFEGTSPAQFQLYNLSGANVLTSMVEPKCLLDVSFLLQGIYLYSIQTGKGSVTGKLVKF